MQLNDKQYTLLCRIAAMQVRAQGVTSWDEWRDVALEMVKIANLAERAGLALRTVQNSTHYGMTGTVVHEPDCDWDVTERGMG